MRAVYPMMLGTMNLNSLGTVDSAGAGSGAGGVSASSAGVCSNLFTGGILDRISDVQPTATAALVERLLNKNGENLT